MGKSHLIQTLPAPLAVGTREAMVLDREVHLGTEDMVDQVLGQLGLLLDLLEPDHIRLRRVLCVAMDHRARCVGCRCGALRRLEVRLVRNISELMFLLGYPDILTNASGLF